MKNVLAITIFAVLLVGCAQSRRDYGTVGGAVVGGGTGAVIGGVATKSIGGAVAGGLIGAAAGGIIGTASEPARRCHIRTRSGRRHWVPC